MAVIVSTATSGFAQNQVLCTTNYYSVTGASLAEVRESMRANRPWKNQSELDGSTDWRVDWRFQLRRTEDGCQIRSFTTTTTITITLPRWIDLTNAAPNARQAWARYLAALSQHEAGHAKNGLAAATELQRQVQEIKSEQQCATLKSTLDKLGQRVVDEFKTKDKDYDRATQHGATQGARLPFAARVER